MRLFIVAGEPSGDLHASNLVKAIKAQVPAVVLEGFGGPLMAEAGVKLHRNLGHLSFMGFTEVVANLAKVRTNFKVAKCEVERFRPHAVILVDYPGFNLRLATWLKKRGLRTIMYIAPQTWAWKEGRVHRMRRDLDLLIPILPFEEAYFQKFGIRTQFCGHPLLDALGQTGTDNNRENLIALMPGSRKQEVERILPEMLRAIDGFDGYRLSLVCSPHVPGHVYQQAQQAGVELFHGPAPLLLNRAKAALVTSGTATLETALCRVPQIVCYKGNPISVWLARRMIKLRHISLVNIILNQSAVPELIQSELNATAIKDKLKMILTAHGRSAQLAHYTRLATMLGHEGASDRAARVIVGILNEN